MGFLSKLWKGVKKTVKKIGKGIKSAVGKVGKFMDKIGIVGQIGLALVLPGLGSMLGQMAGGMMAYTGVGSSIINAAGQFVNAAVNIGTKASSMFSTVTEGITSVIGETVGAVVNQIPGAADWVSSVTSSFSGGSINIADKGFSSVMDAASNAITDVASAGGNLFSSSTLTATNKFALQAAQEATTQSLASAGVQMPSVESISDVGTEFTSDLSLGTPAAEAMTIPGVDTVVSTSVATPPPSLLSQATTKIKELPGRIVDKGMEFIDKAPEKIFDAASSGLEKGVSGSIEASAYKAVGIDTQPIYNQSSYATYVPTIAGPDESVGYGAQLQFSSAPSAQRMLQNPYGYSASEFNNNAYKNRMASYGYNV